MDYRGEACWAVDQGLEVYSWLGLISSERPVPIPASWRPAEPYRRPASQVSHCLEAGGLSRSIEPGVDIVEGRGRGIEWGGEGGRSLRAAEYRCQNPLQADHGNTLGAKHPEIWGNPLPGQMSLGLGSRQRLESNPRSAFV